MSGATLVHNIIELEKLKAEAEAQERTRLKDVFITVTALASIIKKKLNVTESEWSQAVDEAKSRL